MDLNGSLTTVSMKRELVRRKRLWRLVAVLSVIALWFWSRFLRGLPPFPRMPEFGENTMMYLPIFLLVGLLGAVIILPMFTNSRSPHVMFRPEQIEVGFSDVVGLGQVVDEVDHTLTVMLNHEKFRKEMGGRPRRGVLFEGPPGTGKTHLAKALAKEAEVPFLFVSATAFQSMWFGMTARRIKAYFKALRKAARKEGGAIGFIEEIDAIGMQRSGSGSSMTGTHQAAVINRSVSSDTGGMVNELLIQMQSFDEPSGREKLAGKIKAFINLFLPVHRQLKKRPTPYSNILVIGATNRADSLDPALVRPGRFDRILHFGLPSRQARLELIAYFLSSKNHVADLDTERRHNDIAASTLGYSPASVERLFDEALLGALRDGRSEMTMHDILRARREIELGLPEPTEYTPEEGNMIATHEAGHATLAYLVGKGRKLKVLTIVEHKDALGFLAHTDIEERHLIRESEMLARIQIAMGGMVAEELFFGESTSGPGGDLAAATQVAVGMYGAFGLGGSLVSYQTLDTGAVGGNLATKVLTDEKGRAAVDKILHDNKKVATRLLADHRHIVEALRDALLEHEELIDQQIIDVIESAERRHGQTREENTVVDLRGEKSKVDEPVADTKASTRIAASEDS